MIWWIWRCFFDLVLATGLLGAGGVSDEALPKGARLGGTGRGTLSCLKEVSSSWSRSSLLLSWSWGWCQAGRTGTGRPWQFWEAATLAELLPALSGHHRHHSHCHRHRPDDHIEPFWSIIDQHRRAGCRVTLASREPERNRSDKVCSNINLAI